MSDAGQQFTAVELLDSIGQAIIATDPAGRIVYWNDAAEQLYGWTADEALGRDVTTVTVPDVSQEMAAGIMAALQAGGSWSGGFQVHHRNGSVFPVLVTDTAIRRDGEQIGIMGISAPLGTAVRPLLERAADAALVVNADGVVGFASPAVRRLFGWEPTDLLGKPLRRLVHPADQERLASCLDATARAEQSQEIDLRVQDGDGWRTVEMALTSLLDDPAIGGVVCNLHYSPRLAELRERERISGPVHADILQVLFSATIGLDAVLDELPESQRPAVESAIANIAEARACLRRLVEPTG